MKSQTRLGFQPIYMPTTVEGTNSFEPTARQQRIGCLCKVLLGYMLIFDSCFDVLSHHAQILCTRLDKTTVGVSARARMTQQPQVRGGTPTLHLCKKSFTKFIRLIYYYTSFILISPWPVAAAGDMYTGLNLQLYVAIAA